MTTAEEDGFEQWFLPTLHCSGVLPILQHHLQEWHLRSTKLPTGHSVVPTIMQRLA
jgi:hypothetical protein